MDTVALGYVSGVYGVKGQVKIFSFTDPREAIFEYQPWLLGSEMKAVEVTGGRRQGKTLIASLPGVETPEQAREFLQAEIAVARAQLPEAGDDSYYWADLVGLEVLTTAGVPLGRIARMVATGANDVMVVRGEPDGRERLVPFVVGHFVTRVDLAAGVLEVEWDPED
ncbi:ribosome maturation factor RimM [Marinihelvus fidelis]|uniref:Ribosome maturation factor RimM n=1 Tax=Marinihelvus fidelis TaxID=2613842 RepID=A0A5N0TBU7_9GAMM|nr:ribosome maturation factor RimM [Marinihelvus fidelis]KAA9131894.1 ribosome maturation factor RimM [Marinihelvus fidelis]